MNHAIIVLNGGSSSLKFSLYSVINQKLKVESRGQIEGLGTSPRFKAKATDGKAVPNDSLTKSGKAFGHPEAFAHISDWIRDEYSDTLTPLAVGHRVVHGGEFAEAVVIDAQVMAKLEALIPLVPLHQPHNLAAVKGVMSLRPDLPQVAC